MSANSDGDSRRDSGIFESGIPKLFHTPQNATFQVNAENLYTTVNGDINPQYLQIRHPKQFDNDQRLQ